MTLPASAELEYVGFWPRVGASLIDTICLLVITLPLVTAIYGAAYWDGTSFIAGPADVLISWVLPAVLIVVLWMKFGATPGKMALGATIVDARTGAKPTATQALVRYVGYFVAGIPLGLGLIWVGFDPRKQGWHDKMAGTVVVRPARRGVQPVEFNQ